MSEQPAGVDPRSLWPECWRVVVRCPSEDDARRLEACTRLEGQGAIAIGHWPSTVIPPEPGAQCPCCDRVKSPEWKVCGHCEDALHALGLALVDANGQRLPFMAARFGP